MSKLVNVVFLTLCLTNFSDCARILFILPMPSYSHYIVGGELSKAMASVGHQVTVIGPYPPDVEIRNYKYINLPGGFQSIKGVLQNIDLFEYDSLPLITKVKIPDDMGHAVTEHTFNNKEVQTLLNSGEKFDAVVFELFNTEALHGICYHFKAACIVLTTGGAGLWSNRLTGNVGLSSYVADLITDLSPEMSFCERTYNLFSAVVQEIYFHFYSLPKSNELVQKFLPKTPHLYELIYNTSLVLLNSHPALTPSLPLTPNMKYVGGVHLEGLSDVKLSKDVQEFLDKHTEGVVYVALGSNLKSKDLPKEKLNAFIKGLKRWGKSVLWKFEDELPEKMDNVKIGKWFPQTAVLAHKNVRAFVTHSGRLSTMESLYYGVPMVAISVAAEQPHNAAEMTHLGYAIWLKFSMFTANDLFNALVEITSNPKYNKEAKIRSRAMKKHKASQEAIYWIEHVIEFDGAAYLRNAGVKLSWYQFWMVDVFVVFGLILVVIGGFVIYLGLNFICKTKKTKKLKNQ